MLFFQTFRRLTDAEGYSMEYDYLLNLELRMKMEDYIASTYNAGSIVYKNADAFEGAGAEINRNFKAYDIYGIKVNFMTYDYFNSSAIYSNCGKYRFFTIMLVYLFLVETVLTQEQELTYLVLTLDGKGKVNLMLLSELELLAV